MTSLAALCAFPAGAQPPPSNAIPVLYRLDLTIDPAKTNFEGHVEIDMNLPAARKVIHLTGQSLSVAHVEARVAGRTISGRYEQIDEFGHAQVNFDTHLPAGKATLVFDYSSAFENGPRGLFHARIDGRWYAWTELFLLGARRVYPGFDQLNLATPMELTVTAPANAAVVGPSAQISEQSVGDAERHVFARTGPRQPYLLSIGVGEMATERLTLPADGVMRRLLPLQIFAPIGQASKLGFALGQSGEIVQQLETYLDVPFPFDTLSLTASPLEKGGLSAPSSMLFGSDQLLIDAQASARQQRTFGKLVSHEMSHQWFGGMIMPRWWDDSWMLESFANYIGPKVVALWRPDWAQSSFGAYWDMDQDMQPNPLPVHKHLTERQTDQALDFAYGKGAQVLAMLETYLGHQRFMGGVRKFLGNHAYQTVRSEELFDDMAAGAKDPAARAILRSFIDQPGLPLLEIRQQDRLLVVHQAAYVEPGVQAQRRLWTIPFCYHQAEPHCVLLTRAVSRITLPGDAPIVPNVDGTGYYRFDLSAPEWAGLIARAPSLPASEALAINDSLWAGLKTGRTAPGALIAAMRALSQSPEPDAVFDGAKRWMSLRDSGIVSDKAAPDYQAVLAAAFGPRLQEIGFDPAAGHYAAEGERAQRFRAGLVEVLALGAADKSVVTLLDKATQRFLDGDDKALDPAFHRIGMITFVRFGGRPAAEQLLKAAVADEGGTLRPMLVGALGENDDVATSRWLVDQLGHTGLRPADEIDLVVEMLRHTHSQEILLPWLHDNFARIGRLGTNRGSSVWALSSFCDHANDIRSILGEGADSDGRAADPVSGRVIERVTSCARMKSSTQGAIEQALEEDAKRLAPH